MTLGLILGAAVWPDGPSPALRRRTLHGAALYHGGHVAGLVLCGGVGQHPPSEAEAMRTLLRNHNVPDGDLFIEDRSTTTGENIRNALALINTKEVIIITDWYHAPRAQMIARRQGLRARASHPPIKGAKFWPQTKAALREIPAYAAYALRMKH